MQIVFKNIDFSKKNSDIINQTSTHSCANLKIILQTPHCLSPPPKFP